MPELDLEWIRSHLTDLSRPIIKTQEVGDVRAAKARLSRESEARKVEPGARLSRLREHVSRKVGHAKILGKMVSLHGQSNGELDRGAVDLFSRAVEEKEHFRTFRGGEVESKVERFERKDGNSSSPAREEDAAAAVALSELDQRYPFEPAPVFSWSSRFEPSLPRPRHHYTPAKRHSQFRAYYGYLPGEKGAKDDTDFERAKKVWEETTFSSLPPTLKRKTTRRRNTPSPPKRKEEPLYTKITKKSEQGPGTLSRHFANFDYRPRSFPSREY